MSKKQRGGKSSPVLFPNIINEFPVHTVFWEVCAGSGEITKKKKQARVSVAVDKSEKWLNEIKTNCPVPVITVKGCVKEFLIELEKAGPNHLIYIDPPYLLETRINSPNLYEFEMTDQDHKDILSLVKKSTANIVISHYPCELYDSELSGWRTKIMPVSYHGKRRDEKLYMNFPIPDQLHEISFTGNNKDERQRIKRKARRWADKFKSLDPQVRQFVITTLQNEGIIISGPGSYL